MPNSGQTARTIVWAIVALFMTTMAAVTAMVLFVPDPSTSATLVATILPQLAATAAVLVNLRATASVNDKVRKVARDTDALTNGLLDSKVRAGVAEVVHDDALDPDYTEGQLMADQLRRERGAGGTP